MEQDPTQHGKMPDIMAAADIIKHTGTPFLRDLHRIHDRADKVDEDRLEDGRVKVKRPRGAAGERELHGGREARQGQGDIECHADGGHVGAVEDGPPGEDRAGDAEDPCQGHVDGAGNGFAVEGDPLRGEDGGSDEERDSRIVDAGEAGEELVVADAVHGVPHRRADEAFGGRGEEGCRDEDVPFRAEWEDWGRGVDVEGDGEYDEEADEVGPNVDGFVRGPKGGFDAFEFGLAEAVATEDVRITAPR